MSSYECFISYIGKCKPEDWSKYGLNFAFAISVVTGTYGLALVSMVYIYWKIAQVVRNQVRRIDTTTAKPRPGAWNSRDVNTNITTEESKTRKRSWNKGIITLLVVIMAYAICWSPFCILLLIEIGTGSKVGGPAGTVAMLIGFANSCCNPIIYSIKYRKFRKAVISLLGLKGVSTVQSR